MEKQFHFDVTVTAVNSMAECFGLTPEREAQIVDIISNNHDNTDTFPEAMQGICRDVDTMGEFAYACFQLGAFAEHERFNSEMAEKLSNLKDRISGSLGIKE